jgi:hypothetical protein
MNILQHVPKLKNHFEVKSGVIEALRPAFPKEFWLHLSNPVFTMYRWLLICVCCVYQHLAAQTLGGNAVFNFLRLPATPTVAGMGGINLTESRREAGRIFDNPALLSKDMSGQLAMGFNTGFADIKAYTVAAAWDAKKWNTRLAWGLHYLNYGTVAETDASGNLQGNLRPRDWAMQVSAARSYGNRWQYGASLKFIQSSLGTYRANAVAMDVGVQYIDTTHGFSTAITARNMGSVLKSYEGSGPDDLPFDLQIGMSKKLNKAPLAFSLTVHHLHRFLLGYDDIAFDDNGQPATRPSKGFSFENLLRHTVWATHIYLGKYLTADLGFNYLRRRELTIGRSGNGLTGFSLGLTLKARVFQLQYAHSGYQRAAGTHQFGLTLEMDRLTGWGK